MDAKGVSSLTFTEVPVLMDDEVPSPSKETEVMTHSQMEGSTIMNVVDCRNGVAENMYSAIEDARAVALMNAVSSVLPTSDANQTPAVYSTCEVTAYHEPEHQESIGQENMSTHGSNLLDKERDVTDQDNIQCGDILGPDVIALSTQQSKDSPAEDNQVQYFIVKNSTQRSHPKLIDTNGYSYTQQTESKHGIRWRCTVRNKRVFCGATILQKGNMCKKGPKTHCHSGNPKGVLALSVINQVKKQAREQLQKSATQIVNEVLVNNAGCPGDEKKLKFDNLKRVANRFRQKTRPVEPKVLEFDIQHDALPPGFLKGDIATEGRHHLILATATQLQHLSKAKEWYIDTTSKLVKPPFYQLLTVQCFTQKDDKIMQVPFAFFLMSGKRKRDYKIILKAFRCLFPHGIHLSELVVDFDSDLWVSLAKVFPGVPIKGCAYHWKQTIWKCIKDLGMYQAYMGNGIKHDILNQLMGLPYMPVDVIPNLFKRMQKNVHSPDLQLVFDVINSQWIESTLWPPSVWSNYRHSIRTRNDVEGWLDRIEEQTKKQSLPLYSLIEHLHCETEMANTDFTLVNEKKLKKLQKKQSLEVCGLLNQFWDEYVAGTKSGKSLLQTCVHLHDPKELA
ncbi:uncharacterized protein LOC117107990 [Anneissia japonica]|uniref:uncharacterized protein LOC117107990 n=1 Tax=Anneissia japonica TaxID=1529436 RepID=UPI001425A1B3|nr:uncharacterized protein LOC117107990 [Anneissia japonica]